MALSAMPTAAGLRKESRVSQALGELGSMRSADQVSLHAQKVPDCCSLQVSTVAPSYFASVQGVFTAILACLSCERTGMTERGGKGARRPLAGTAGAPWHEAKTEPKKRIQHVGHVVWAYKFCPRTPRAPGYWLALQQAHVASALCTCRVLEG